MKNKTNLRYKIYVYALFIINIEINYSQTIPNQFYKFKIHEIFFDAGENWDYLSNFESVRFQFLFSSKNKNPDQMPHQFRLGLYNNNSNLVLYGFGHFLHSKHIYGYVYPELFKKEKIDDYFFENRHQTQKLKHITLGTDMSGFGFQNNWVNFQICRGRENWGSGNDIQLALNNNSNSYDYIIIGSDYGKVRVKYIHGFLETVNKNINRYIVAKGIEWTNKKSFIFGLSEILIYSGEGRTIEIAYLNPISSHIEIELNNRLKVLGTESANAVWQAHLDWLILNNLRFSWNYLYDEFVIDPKIEKGKEHGNAYSTKTVFTPVNSEKHILSLFISYSKVGTPTFRHSNGTNNFVQKGKPIGWSNGSDGVELKIGLNYFKRNNFLGRIHTGLLKSGEENIKGRPYEVFYDYLEGKFPSGDVQYRNFLDSEIEWWWKKNISILIKLSINKINYDAYKNSISFGINAYTFRSKY